MMLKNGFYSRKRELNKSSKVLRLQFPIRHGTAIIANGFYVKMLVSELSADILNKKEK